MLMLGRKRFVVRHLQMAEDHLKPLVLVFLIGRSTMLGLAVRVVGKAFNYPAGRHSPARALADHPFQLATQRLQDGDSLFDVIEMEARDGIGVSAGPLGVGRQRQQVANLGDLEAEVARVTDKPERVRRSVVVTPLVSVRTVRRGQ